VDECGVYNAERYIIMTSAKEGGGLMVMRGVKLRVVRTSARGRALSCINL
jgi:hypothetical protein